MFAKRVLIWSVVACFAVFLGVDLATRGIQDVYGPLPSSGSAGARMSDGAGAARPGVADLPAQASPETRASNRRQAASAARGTLPQAQGTLPPSQGPESSQAPVSDPAEDPTRPSSLYPYLYESGRDETLVNRMADTTVSIVRRTANRGVTAFVSLFDAIVGSR